MRGIFIFSPKFRRKGPCEERPIYDPFKGNNESNEMETLEEYLSRAQADQSFEDVVFQQINFTSLSAEDFLRFSYNSAWFLGCSFPNGTIMSIVVSFFDPSFRGDS